MRPEVPVTALDGRTALSCVIRGGGDLGGLSWLAVGVGGGRALAVGGGCCRFGIGTALLLLLAVRLLAKKLSWQCDQNHNVAVRESENE